VTHQSQLAKAETCQLAHIEEIPLRKRPTAVVAIELNHVESVLRALY